MDTTIRNLDDHLYRKAKARAALARKTIGEVVNEALRDYLQTPTQSSRHGTLRDLRPESYPEGCERLSEEIDALVYGADGPS